MSNHRVTLVVSIDTEEDSWTPMRGGLTVDNVRQLPRLAGFLGELGVRATYFATFQVATRPWAVDVLRGIAAAGTSEVGAHLHPWNTPPLATSGPIPTMLLNHPFDVQLAKIRHLTQALAEVLSVRPNVFRAGRFGLGAATVTALLACDYQVDCRVTPYLSWKADDDGPDFIGAPTHIYALDVDSDPRVPVPGGRLIEVPISAGFTRFDVGRWPLWDRVLRHGAIRRLGLAGIAARTELMRRLILSPETNTVPQMLALSRRLIVSGARYVHLFFHSSSLVPGLNPFARTARDVERIYRRIDDYVVRLAAMADVSFATIGEVAAVERSAGRLDEIRRDPASGTREGTLRRVQGKRL